MKDFVLSSQGKAPHRPTASISFGGFWGNRFPELGFLKLTKN